MFPGGSILKPMTGNLPVEASAPTHVQRRRADLVASLSLALDMATGAPLERSLRTAIVGLNLADILGLTPAERSEVFYVALLRWLGCTADAAMSAAIFGDELAVGEWIKPVMGDGPIAFIRALVRNHAADEPPMRRAVALVRAMTGMPQVMAGMTAHCEVAQRLSQRMGFDESVTAALGQVYEFWNGTGLPRHLKGDQIARSVRIVTFAEDLQLFQRISGREAAVGVARRRSGNTYDPAIVAAFLDDIDKVFAGLLDEVPWSRLLEIEPRPWSMLDEAQFDVCLEAIADFCDLKSSYFGGHSRAVAATAEAAASVLGVSRDDVTALRRAALVHELGLAGISSAVLEKASPLSEIEEERLRLHPYYTERVLSKSPGLAPLGMIASQHHERLDGSGYFRGAVASMLGSPARILAVACAFHTLTADMPGRAALSIDAAAAQLREEVAAGRLDRQATEAVLEVVGVPARRYRASLPAGLSEREVEVLCLLARGRSRKEVAAELVIADKTVARHIEHIYDKIGASTRPAATLFAIEHGLLTAWEMGHLTDSSPASQA
jgi:HD-GYP domain-containing protein (c-di-GMP phosphodiesterase class II)